MTPSDINVMKHGRRPISGATVGLLCDLLELDGEESRRLLALAVVEAAPPEKQGVLRRAFFVSWAIGATAGWVASTTTGDAQSMTAAELLIGAASMTAAKVIAPTKAELTKDLLSVRGTVYTLSYFKKYR